LKGMHSKQVSCFQFVFILMLLLSFNNAVAQNDSSKKVQSPIFTYHKIGIDISKIVASPLVKNYDVLEFQWASKYKNNLWAAAEFGLGNSKIDNQFVKYTNSNQFIRLGIDKILFRDEFFGDYSNAFIGVRYAGSLVKRNEANYFIEDSIWSNVNGSIPKSNFYAHWVELTGGFSLEVKKNIFFGSQIRFKTFFNPKKFQQLPPYYLAGFGRAEENSAFSYNFYLHYGLGKRN
jgi:hypothetical protein